MAWASPRIHMERLFSQAEMHRDCSDTNASPHGAARAKNVREIAHCCATSEWLLWYAQSQRGARHAGLAELAPAISEREISSVTISRSAEIAIRRTTALEPDVGHFTLLRDASNACERSLSKSYAEDKAYQLKLQARHGLSVATGRRLRRLFGSGNISECRRALEPWAMSVRYEVA